MSAVVIAAPCGAYRATWTAQAGIRGSVSTLPASGPCSCVPAAPVSACLFSSGLLPQRRKTVGSAAVRSR